RREGALREAPPGDVGEDHHAGGALVAAAGELLERAIRVLPGQRGEPADPVGVRSLGLRHRGVRLARRCGADGLASPVHVGAGQGDGPAANAAPRQYTLGQVSETIETSMPAPSIVAIWRS